MPAAEIPLPLSSAPGSAVVDQAGRLINVRVEPKENSQGAIYRRSAGLVAAVTFREAGWRGGIVVDDVLYAIVGQSAYRVVGGSGGPIISRLGLVPGIGPVTLARNNRVPIPQVVCVDEFGVRLIADDGVQTLPFSGLPQFNSVTFFDGYFVFTTRDGRFYASGLNDVTVNDIDVAVAESVADGLLRAIRRGNDLVLFGEKSLEYWRNAGNAVGSPFSRVATSRGGLISPHAVTGYEPDLPAQTPIIFVDAAGGVVALDGYNQATISSPAVQRAIAATADPADIRLSSYVVGGVTRVVLSLSDQTWEYDLRVRTWVERRSYLSDRWRCWDCVSWRGVWHAGSQREAILYSVDETATGEGSEPLPMTIESMAFQGFPTQFRVHRLDVMATSGHGDVAASSPAERDGLVDISWSKDGGATWSDPVVRAVGPAGAWRMHPSVKRLGTFGARGLTVRLHVASGVPVVVAGMTCEVEGRSR